MQVLYEGTIRVSLPALPEDDVADRLFTLMEKNAQLQGAFNIIERELKIVFEIIPGARIDVMRE